MNTLIYFIKETFRGFFQAKVMTFVSIVTIAITLFSLGGITVVFMNIRLWLNEASKKPGINAYLNDKVYDDSLSCEKKMQKIVAFEEVESVVLIGKDDAWNDFKRDYGEDMLEAVDENPLPASFQITLKGDFLAAKTKLCHALDWIKSVENTENTRILFAHRICDTFDGYSWPPKYFELILRYAVENGINVKTMGEVYG